MLLPLIAIADEPPASDADTIASKVTTLQVAAKASANFNTWAQANAEALRELVADITLLDAGKSSWLSEAYCRGHNRGWNWVEGKDLAKQYSPGLYTRYFATAPEVLETIDSSRDGAVQDACIGAVRLGILEDNFQKFVGKGAWYPKYQRLFSRYLLTLTPEEALTALALEIRMVAAAPKWRDRDAWLQELLLKQSLYEKQ